MSGVPEDEPQRLARNINDLLQELRVALAGVQILLFPALDRVHRHLSTGH
jgi:hypothetical protein